MNIEEIKAIITPIIEAKGLFLVDLSVSNSNVIEIFVDSLTGVNIASCMEVSREIEQKIDREKEDFELTVSSAGIGYPFKVDGQYQKNLGKNVEIKFNDNTKLEGVLKAFDQQNIVVEAEEKKTIEGKKKKELVKIEKNISRDTIKQIKDIITF